MVAKGGLFFPMYQREAMWISFKANKPFLIKIYCGGINVVSGEHRYEDMSTKLRRQTLRADRKSVQDYLVVPDQCWIDGIAAEPGLVKQFVAMPLGAGYSIEAQLTGQETTGGLQFEITPAVFVEPMPNPKLDSWSIKQAAIPPQNLLKLHIQTLTGKTFDVVADQKDSVAILKHRIAKLEGIPADQQRLIHHGKHLLNEHTIDQDNFQEHNSVYLVIGLRGGGPCEHSEMAIAAGGLIRQTIVIDGYPKSTWRQDLTTTFNVQILNSTAFKNVTGRNPPRSPVNAKTYAEQGLPFFKMWEETSLVHGNFDKVKSVATIDNEVEPKQSYPVIEIGKYGTRIDSELAKRIDDPDGIMGDEGPVRKFRTVHDLEEEIDAMPTATFE